MMPAITPNHSEQIHTDQKALLYQQTVSYSHMFSVILEEIQRTSCQPREVCVEVAKEYPESTSQFYLPRCVALHRCGGCCNNEAYYCTNTSHSLVNKTVSGFLFFLSCFYTVFSPFSTLLCWCLSPVTLSWTETNRPSYVTRSSVLHPTLLQWDTPWLQPDKKSI